MPFGRLVHEGNAAVLAGTLSIGRLWLWKQTQHRSWIIGTAVAFGLGIYTYSITHLFLPLIVVLIAIFFMRQVLIAHWRQAVVALMIALLIVSPMLYLQVRYPDKMQARYRAVAVIRPDRPLLEGAKEALQNATYNLSPRFLFLEGDQDELYHPRGVGQLYMAQLGLVVIGTLWGLVHSRTRQSTIILWMWILCAVLPAALTIHRPGSGSGNASRSLLAVTPWQILSGIGISALLDFFRQRNRVFALMICFTLLGWVGRDAWHYYGYYFQDYAIDAYDYFDAEMPAIIDQVERFSQDYDAIYLTCLVGSFPYTQILFFTRYDPHILQTDLPERGDWLFAPVWRVGKYHIVCDIEDLWNMGLPGLYVVPGDRLPDVTPLAIIPTQPGHLGYKVIGRRTFNYDFASLSWLGQCNQPSAPLNERVLRTNIPVSHTRVFDFDCTSTWVYPAAEGHGAYLFHAYLFPGDPSRLQEIVRTTDPFLDRHIEAMHFAFAMPKFTRTFPAFAIYESNARPLIPVASLRGALLPATAPLPVTGTSVLSSPVPLQGPLLFLGTVVYQSSASLEIETWWQVQSGPIERPFSIMAHLLTDKGDVLGIADGLGVSPLVLRENDILVQRHRFQPVLSETGLWFRTGVYWLDTMERWPVADHPDADAIFIPLSSYLNSSP